MGKGAHGYDGVPISRHRRLRLLTILLLLLVAAWAARYYIFERPSNAHQRRVAAFSDALRIIGGHYWSL